MERTGSITVTIKRGEGNSVRLGYANFTLLLNTSYDVRIVDDGQQITGYINDLANPLFAFDNSHSYGNHLVLFNREFVVSDSIVALDFINITAVPIRPKLAIVPDGNGGYFIRAQGSPNFTCQLERSPGLTGPWTVSAPQTASAAGLIEFHDLFAPSGQAFYRTVQQQ